jgi:small GTP-binding protein
MAGKKGVKTGKKKEAQHTERKKLSSSERIEALEEEIRTTKYNKRTQHAIGLLKAKLAILKQRAVQRASVGKAKGDERFSVRRTGDGTVLLLGFPSVGKSTLLNKLTRAKSDIAAYAFTTLSAVPGLMEYKHAKIQIIDVPGVVSGAASGKGRGKEVLSMLRNADLILILIEALYPQHYKALLREVYETGVRLNEKKPDVRITKKERGGIRIGTTVKLDVDKKVIQDVAREFKISNADILIRDKINIDQFIDVLEGNRTYTKSLTIITKTDLVSQEKLKKLCLMIKPDVIVSAEKDIGIKELRESIYNKLGLISIFLKETNKKADMEIPLIMFKNCTIRDVCNKLHKDFVTKFKFARVWGKSAKFDGQVFRKMDKILLDGDVLELHMN